jgi:hypothetical protein
MTPVQITDYKAKFDVPPYLIEFFYRGGSGTDLSRYAAALDVQYQQIEQALFDIMTQLWLDWAVGAQLDVLGVHLNLPRNGMDDTTYRLLLGLQAFVNHGSGTPEAMISVIRIICNDPAPLYLPAYPGGFVIQTVSGVGVGIDYDEVDNSGNFVIDNLGNRIEVALYTPLTPGQMFAIAPAGVQMYTQYLLLDNNSNQMVDNLGNSLAVLIVYPVSEP